MASNNCLETAAGTKAAISQKAQNSTSQQIDIVTGHYVELEDYDLTKLLRTDGQYEQSCRIVSSHRDESMIEHCYDRIQTQSTR